jgi:hypothetical protein
MVFLLERDLVASYEWIRWTRRFMWFGLLEHNTICLWENWVVLLKTVWVWAFSFFLNPFFDTCEEVSIHSFYKLRSNSYNEIKVRRISASGCESWLSISEFWSISYSCASAVVAGTWNPLKWWFCVLCWDCCHITERGNSELQCHKFWSFFLCLTSSLDWLLH